MGRSGGELAKRVAVAAVGIPLTVLAAYMGGFWIAAFLAGFAGVAAWEFCMMYGIRGVPSAPLLAALLASAYLMIAAIVGPERFAIAVVILTLGVAAIAMLSAAPESQPGLRVVTTVFAAIYTGVLLSFAVWLRGMDEAAPGWRGTAILFLPVAVTWLGDTAAYTIGRAFGSHKLAPVTSPSKTWEGAIAGLLASAGGAVLYAELTQGVVDWHLPVVALLAFGALISIVGQLGDLFESRFKRDCGVKDSSQLLPGHGGILDRIDSLLFAFPFAYVFLTFVGL